MFISWFVCSLTFWGLNILKTVVRGSVPVDHQQQMANRMVRDQRHMTFRSQGCDPSKTVSLRPIISKTAGDTDSVIIEH